MIKQVTPLQGSPLLSKDHTAGVVQILVEVVKYQRIWVASLRLEKSETH